jgi:hypothetical protein
VYSTKGLLARAAEGQTNAGIAAAPGDFAAQAYLLGQSTLCALNGGQLYDPGPVFWQHGEAIACLMQILW